MRPAVAVLASLLTAAGVLTALLVGGSPGDASADRGTDRVVTGANGTVTVTRTVYELRRVRVPPVFRISGPRDSIRAVAALRRQLDEQAQAMAQKLVPAVERCRAVTLDYTLCDSSSDLAPYGAAALTIGSAAGEVSVIASTDVSFTVAAESRTGNEFRISRTSGGELTRTCDTDGYGACRAGGTW